MKIRVERGPEYKTFRASLPANASQTIRLERWIDMRKRGYASGENHLHVDTKDLGAMLVRLWGRLAYRARGAGQAGVNTWLQHGAVLGIVHLKNHLGGACVGMPEPLRTGATDSTLTASLRHEIFPGLSRACLE